MASTAPTTAGLAPGAPAPPSEAQPGLAPPAAPLASAAASTGSAGAPALAPTTGATTGPAAAAAGVPGVDAAAAAADPHVPATAKEAPLSGPPPADGVSFKDQVRGYAKYTAGKLTGNDKEVQQGAAVVRGVDAPAP
ncbi:hypothetical protein FA09DRAFT_332666 [Tilletiopsis washingtonensis]|uniref:Uncharacterized protein n=1 Tax=Tilletiopsis washingtonensis TaxID=58919 RepID=A0A316Z0D4_9BASI|nr:hypothetical protein FA09DRAFT_332666 [Tilletiopsis washingtonensis]PWN94756.1 hypothetical protein FA09DRAFT_332666 [Tilletiopsis washingtonensis]